MAGTLHLPRGLGRRPAVLLCHGFTGTKTETHSLFVKAARAFARAGLAAYRFDFRGSGESGGAFATMTIGREIGDAHAALGVLARQPGVDPRRLGVVGLSLGGCVAANLAARDARVRSLALWAAVGDTSAWFRSFRARHRRAWRRPDQPLDLGGTALLPRFFTGAAAVNPLDALGRSRRRFPVLVLHGTADPAVPVSVADTYFKVLARRGYPARKLILAGVDHTFNRLDWEADVLRATTSWFRRTLAA